MYRAIAVCLFAVCTPVAAKCIYLHYGLSGTVKDQSGEPVAGATIEVSWRDALEAQSERFKSEVAGVYAGDLIFSTFSKRTLSQGDVCESRLSSAHVNVVAPGFKPQSAIVHFTNQRAEASFVLGR